MVGVDIASAVMHLTQGGQEALNFETLRMNMRVDLHLPTGAQDIRMNLGLRAINTVACRDSADTHTSTADGQRGKEQDDKTANAKLKEKEARESASGAKIDQKRPKEAKTKSFWASVRASVSVGGDSKKSNRSTTKRLRRNSDGVLEERDSTGEGESDGEGADSDVGADTDRFNSDSDSEEEGNSSDNAEGDARADSSVSSSVDGSGDDDEVEGGQGGYEYAHAERESQVAPTSVEMVEPFFTTFYHRYNQAEDTALELKLAMAEREGEVGGTMRSMTVDVDAIMVTLRHEQIQVSIRYIGIKSMHFL